MGKWNARDLVIRRLEPPVVDDRETGRVLVTHAQNAIELFYQKMRIRDSIDVTIHRLSNHTFQAPQNADEGIGIHSIIAHKL